MGRSASKSLSLLSLGLERKCKCYNGYFVNGYLKCHHITDGNTDRLKSVGISQRVRKQLLVMPPHHRRPYRHMQVRWYFTENSKTITGNAIISLTDTPTYVRPSVFHREFENNYLKCHHITDGLKSVGISQRVQKQLLVMPPHHRRPHRRT